MKPYKVEVFDAPIIFLKIVQDQTLLFVDSETTVRYSELETLKVVHGFKAKVMHSCYLSYTPNVVDFSEDGNIFAFIAEDLKESRLYDVNSKKSLARVTQHSGEVTAVALDPKGRYMLSGGEDGHTYVINVATSQMILSLPNHIDTITDIAFSKSGNLVATASYDKKISLFNLSLMEPQATLRMHQHPIINLLFLEDGKLLSIDKRNNALIWDTKAQKVYKRLEGIHDDITQLLEIAEHKLLIVGTKLGYLLVYTLNDFSLLSKSYIKLSSSITALTYHKKSDILYIGTNDAKIHLYKLFEGLEEAVESLKQKQYVQLENFLEKNPLLRLSRPYEVMEHLWEKTYEKTISFLEKGDEKSALKLVEPFMQIATKKKLATRLILDYKDFSKFKKFVQEGKLSLAYALAYSNPLYQKSHLYQELEKKWKNDFITAQKYALDPKVGVQKAKEILSPYRGVSQKTKYIQELVVQSEVFKRFTVALANKQFALLFELTKQHPFLAESDEYSSLMTHTYQLHDKAIGAIAEGDLHQAIKVFTLLLAFPPFVQEAKEQLFLLDKKLKFFNAFEEKNYIVAYTLLDTYEVLQETHEGEELQLQWSEDLSKANNSAALGDINGVKRALQNYMDISSKHKHIALVIGWCYRQQLQKAIEEKKDLHSIENGFKKYVLNLGVLEQIKMLHERFLQLYPESKLHLEKLHHGSLELWRPSMIVNSILD